MIWSKVSSTEAEVNFHKEDNDQDGNWLTCHHEGRPWEDTEVEVLS
jgi:hypothetical protein